MSCSLHHLSTVLSAPALPRPALPARGHRPSDSDVPAGHRHERGAGERHSQRWIRRRRRRCCRCCWRRLAAAHRKRKRGAVGRTFESFSCCAATTPHPCLCQVDDVLNKQSGFKGMTGGAAARCCTAGEFQVHAHEGPTWWLAEECALSGDPEHCQLAAGAQQGLTSYFPPTLDRQYRRAQRGGLHPQRGAATRTASWSLNLPCSSLKSPCSSSSTGSIDVRSVEDCALRGEEDCQLALAVFLRRIRKYLGAYLVTLGGRVDAIVFSAGERRPSTLAAPTRKVPLLCCPHPRQARCESCFLRVSTGLPPWHPHPKGAIVVVQSPPTKRCTGAGGIPHLRGATAQSPTHPSAPGPPERRHQR